MIYIQIQLSLIKIKLRIRTMTDKDTKKHLITDYVRTTYLVPNTRLRFDIYEDHTIVHAEYDVISASDSLSDLVLNGHSSVELLSIKCNNQQIPYVFIEEFGEKNLVINKNTIEDILESNSCKNKHKSKSPNKRIKLTKQFTLQIKCKINPASNTELQGLYLSNNTFCTQCESH